MLSLLYIFKYTVGAIAYGYSNIFVTAPSPENLKTVFEFIQIGLKALKYSEHLDYEVCHILIYPISLRGPLLKIPCIFYVCVPGHAGEPG